jgi:Hg(II)-responsive transcriptional regulator
MNAENLMNPPLKESLSIGKVSQLSGVKIETIRFYETKGLLQEPLRRESGYRQYQPDVLTRLRFIKKAQNLGFSLSEIKQLLMLELNPQTTRTEIKSIALGKILHIQNKIQDLQNMKKTLMKLTEQCSGKGKIEGCPILEAFKKGI